jgi:hypothetical protein
MNSTWSGPGYLMLGVPRGWPERSIRCEGPSSGAIGPRSCFGPWMTQMTPLSQICSDPRLCRVAREDLTSDLFLISTVHGRSWPVKAGNPWLWWCRASAALCDRVTVNAAVTRPKAGASAGRPRPCGGQTRYESGSSGPSSAGSVTTPTLTYLAVVGLPGSSSPDCPLCHWLLWDREMNPQPSAVRICASWSGVPAIPTAAI